MRRDFDLESFWGRKFAWLYAMVVEHNFINLIRLNFHQISDEAFRSAQPTMEQLERYTKKYGIKTIINLKGEDPAGAYFLFEKEKCEELGLKLVNVGIKSRGIPHKEAILKAKNIFDDVEYPIWMHCKAGADRTGIYATLYQNFRKKIPVSETDQLKLIPFGHVKESKAGKVDHYFNTFKRYEKMYPNVDFFQWSQEVADPKVIDEAFKLNPIADFINDRILRRE